MVQLSRSGQSSVFPVIIALEMPVFKDAPGG
jgi:hypothetical protein